MARIRSLKPGFWTDSKMVRLSPYARLFYMGTWNFALCEKGHLPDDAFELKLQILPADNVDVDELLDELIGAGRIERRKTVSGETYLIVTRLANHNKSDARWATTCQYCKEESTPEPDQPPADSSVPRRDSREARRGSDGLPETQPRKGIGREGKEDICAPDEPAHASVSFALDEPLADPTYEIGSDEDPRWIEFWATVANKDGKIAAREAWANHVLGKGEYHGKKIPKSDPDAIIAGMKLYAARMKAQGTARKHIKMVQGWLNERRWEDELARHESTAEAQRPLHIAEGAF